MGQSRVVGTRSFDIWALIPAVLAPVFLLFGYSYHQTDSAEYVTGSLSSLLFSAVVGFGLAVIIYYVVKIIFRLWSESIPETHRETKVISHQFYIKLGVILLFWIPWWIIHYPGAVDDDTIYQYLQTIGYNALTNHHPIFDTWLFGLVWSLGDALGSKSTGLAIFTGLNTLATAIALALMISYLIARGMPKKLGWVITIWFSAVPLIPIYAMSMTKDYLFGWIFCLYMLCFIETLRTRGAALRSGWFIAGLIATSLFSMLTKQTGLYCVFFATIILIIACKPLRKRVTASTVPVLVVYLFFVSLLPHFGVAKTSNREMLSIPFQQTARYIAEYPDDVTDHDKESINKILPYDELADAYNPRRSDAVKNRYITESTTGDLMDYFGTWLSMGLRHPGVYISATFNNTYDYFFPVPMDDLYDQVDPGMFAPDRMDYWYAISDHDAGTKEELTEKLSGIQAAPAFDSVRTGVNDAYDTIRHTPVFEELLAGALYCFWIPLLVACLAAKRRNYFALLCLVPFLIVLGTLIAGPIALPRYLSTSIYLTPLALGLPYLRFRAQHTVAHGAADHAITQAEATGADAEANTAGNGDQPVATTDTA